MIERNLKLKLLFAAVCSLALVLIPLSAHAQSGIWHGAQQGVEKGAQGVQKGAESVGHETKKVITGEDNDQTKTQSQEQTTTQEQQRNARMKGGTQTETSTATTEKSERGQTKQTEGKALPRTAGELPLLALAGCLALAGAGASRLIRREE